MKWRVAFLGADRASREWHKQLLSQFRQLYQAAGEPEGAALYEAVETSGKTHALCLNPAAVKHFPQLLKESSWVECDTPSIFKLCWAAGDERLNNRST